MVSIAAADRQLAQGSVQGGGRKVHDLRATGLSVQTVQELNARDEMEKSKRAASGSAAGGRSSAASQLSARRLERQREREALRKQPKPWQ